MVRETEISTQYGFKIYEMIPMRGVYLIKTNKGNKCLKKINYGIQKLMYIYNAKAQIIKNGFDRIDKYVLNTEGSPYALVNEDIYIVTDWIDGRECDFKKVDDLRAAARTLGEFHKCARGFSPEENLRVRDDIGKLPMTLEKRLITLGKMRDIARKNKRKTDFDIMYLENVEYYKKLAQESIKALDINCYKNVCQDSIINSVLCHHDFTYHNIIFNNDNVTHIVDFDYCKSEVQIYDVSTLLVKSLKRLNWNKDYAGIILDEYNSAKPISKDEYNVLKALLMFPQRFWRLANRYYYREAGWSESTFIKKMKEIVDERERYQEFVSRFDEVIR